MNMTVINVLNVLHHPDNDIFDVHLRLGQEDDHFKANVQNNQGIRCLQCDDNLENILWRDLGEAKKFNRLVFSVYEGKQVAFPVRIGNF